ncbi:MAG: phosphoribosylamine--glycine ligase [Pseudomonadota bacterium]
MHILLVGGGGREHALAWKIAQSPLLTRLTCAPGNPGMAALGSSVEMAPTLGPADVPAFAKAEGVDLVVVGPEAPLADGLADQLAELSIPCFGPNAAGAQLETSKAFTKDLCAEHDIPTAAYGRFDDADTAKAFLRTMKAPYVIKADGIAAGKGVVIVKTLEAADAAVDEMLAGQFGDASATIVIEEFLTGTEASVFAITDGQTLLHCGDAQDHKRAFDGDKGPNTGGMGCFSPSPLFTDDLKDATYERIIAPTLKALQEKGITYRGVLYAGLMLTNEGPKLIEYNARFGDPECQILMRRLKSDLVPALLAAATGRLEEVNLDWSAQAAANIVYATKGYPGAYDKGSEIKNLDRAEAQEATVVFHAGTKTDGTRVEEGRLLANGGRVLNVTALGADLSEALDKAYAGIAEIDWPEGFYRTDIGKRYRG